MNRSKVNTIAVAKHITRVYVERGDNEVTVVIQGDGRLTYRLVKGDRHHFGLDLPHVVSSIRFQVLPVDHAILKNIRIGHYPSKLRLVFDVNQSPDQPIRYAVKGQGKFLAVRLTK